MLLRLIAGAGLLALGYYVGKQVGRMEPIREDLERSRNERTADQAEVTDDQRPRADDSGGRGS